MFALCSADYCKLVINNNKQFPYTPNHYYYTLGHAYHNHTKSSNEYNILHVETLLQLQQIAFNSILKSNNNFIFINFVVVSKM